MQVFIWVPQHQHFSTSFTSPFSSSSTSSFYSYSYISYSFIHTFLSFLLLMLLHTSSSLPTTTCPTREETPNTALKDSTKATLTLVSDSILRSARGTSISALRLVGGSVKTWLAGDGNTAAEVRLAMRNVFGRLAALVAKESRCYFGSALRRG